jgi:hypothetical protein
MDAREVLATIIEAHGNDDNWAMTTTEKSDSLLLVIQNEEFDQVFLISVTQKEVVE